MKKYILQALFYLYTIFNSCGMLLLTVSGTVNSLLSRKQWQIKLTLNCSRDKCYRYIFCCCCESFPSLASSYSSLYSSFNSCGALSATVAGAVNPLLGKKQSQFTVNTQRICPKDTDFCEGVCRIHMCWGK